jgi:TonB family protein
LGEPLKRNVILLISPWEVCLRSKIFVVVVLLFAAANLQTAFCAQKAFPVVLTAVRPPYPALAAAKKISGTVLVDIEVNAEGKISNAEVIDGPELLRDISRIAARSWTFKAPDSGVFTVRLTFIFHDESFVPPKQAPDFTSPFQVEILRPKEQF